MGAVLHIRLKMPFLVAVQWKPGVEIEGVEENPMEEEYLEGQFYLDSIKGWIHLKEDDWIVQDEHGFRSAVADEEFRRMYEIVKK
jgi:hypothetical protein